MSLLKELIDPKLIRIIDLFIDNKTKLFHLTDIASKSKVPLTTSFRLVKKLVRLKLVEYSIIGKLKIYRYNDSENFKKIEEIIRL